MSDMNLSDRWPEMRPIRKPPGLMTINGIGTSVVGSRDYDDETGTYVKTYCFSVLFIPLVALGAYRVANADGGGWYFLGKVPLSGFARAWNCLLVVLVLGVGGFFGWRAYTDSPSYLAGQRLAQADRLAAEGKGREAAEIYREVMTGPTGRAAEARAKLQGLLESPPAAAEEAAGVFQVALDLHRQDQSLVPDLFERGLKLAEQHEQADPKGALAVLEVVTPLAPRAADHLALRRKLLERLVAQSPGDVELASRLAVVYEALGDRARCEAVLAPHEKRLGLLEGAAILGRTYAAQGKYDRAHALLQPFVDARLPKLRAAEQAFQSATKRAEDEAFERLKKGGAPGFDYAKHKSASQVEQNEMVSAYVFARIKEDPAVRAARQALAAEEAVVSAVIDLGLLHLQRAQALADPAARQAGLRKAEEAFLSVRDQAGGSDVYRLSLGQVYYWLGKHAEGRKLFDGVLAAQKRAPDVLLAVSRLLREVGDFSEARALAEEAYNKETERAKKFQAAGTRAVMYLDVDDRITWLGRCNPDDPQVKADLCSARGQKAMQEGQEEAAAAQYRQAIEIYGRMPENPATLNNCAIVHFALFGVTHDPEQFTRGIDKLDRAIALKPGDSILLSNAASEVLESAVRDVVGAAVDLKLLKRGAGLDLLSFLYRDRAGKQKVVALLRKHPGFVKARGYYEKLMLLAPKRAEAYAQLAALHAYTGDLDGLRGVRQRLKGIELDLAHENRETLAIYAGQRDDKLREDARKSLARREAVLPAARKAVGVTLAVATTELARAKMSGAGMGLPADADEVVKLAEEAHAAAPSFATQSYLRAALLFRAHRSLTKNDGAYAELAARTRRSLGPSLLSYVLGREAPLRDKALANPDVKRALALKLEQDKAFPDDRGPGAWALLRAAYPEEAKRIAERAPKEPLHELQRSINAALSPLSASTALDAYWALLMAGKGAEAEAVLEGYAAKGVPLPTGKK
jgi:hypothetical protein